MKRTTTREYDAEGKLVKETIAEDSADAPVWNCTCRWAAGSTIAYCPAHGYIGPQYPTIWCGTAAPSGTITINTPTTTTYALTTNC